MSGTSCNRVAMSDLLAAIGLLFVVEGLIFAALPQLAKRAMAAGLEQPEARLRITGLVSAFIGILIVWWMRG